MRGGMTPVYTSRRHGDHNVDRRMDKQPPQGGGGSTRTPRRIRFVG